MAKPLTALSRSTVIGCVLVFLLAGCSAGNDPNKTSVLPGGLSWTQQSRGSWTTKASMPTSRYGLSVGVVNGILYAIGGDTINGPSNTVEAYDPATDTWSAKASMPTARYW